MKILFITGMLLLSTIGISQTINQKYPGSWVEPRGVEMQEISKALVQANVRGCGEYYVRESASDSKEYLVACTSDGKNWSYYIVWSRIPDVMGPYSRDASIKNPY